MNRHWLITAVTLIFLSGLVLAIGCSSAPEAELKPRAAIVDQLYALRPNPEFIDGTARALEAGGFAVDIYQGDEVTVGLYRNLASNGYRLVIFRAHSGILGVREGSDVKLTEGTWLFTNEAYRLAKYPGEQLGRQMGKARMDENHPWVFALGARFVSQSIKGQFPGTVIIMMGCSSLLLDDLAQAFLQKGASAYLGWSATVDLTYVDGATASLVRRLVIEQLTVEAAVAATMVEIGPDPTWGAVLRYYPAESGRQAIIPPNQ